MRDVPLGDGMRLSICKQIRTESCRRMASSLYDANPLMLF